MKREGSGLREVDLMMEGGFPRGAIIGISGPPGVGKSIFALHFLLEGARKGQKGVYINLEEPRSNIDNLIKSFSFSDEFYKYEAKKLIVIKCFNYSEYEQINFDILEKIKKDKKIERLVIDSFNCFFDFLGNYFNTEDATNVRKLVNSSFSLIRKENMTTLLVLEKNENYLVNFDYNIPYLVDGIIKLDYLDLGIIERQIFISKMRWTNQFKESKCYEITNNGIEIREVNV